MNDVTFEKQNLESLIQGQRGRGMGLRGGGPGRGQVCRPLILKALRLYLMDGTSTVSVNTKHN